MLDILLISDQPRLHAIFTSACTFPEGSFRIATSLDQGLQQVGERSPDLLFLQNRLSGLAGLILVRHVRSNSAPSAKIVLLADDAAELDKSAADIVLHTNVSDSELSDAVSEIIGETAPEESPHTAEPAPGYSAIPALPSAEAVDSVSLTASAPPSLPDRIKPLQITHAPASGTATLPGKEPPQQTTILTSSPPPIQWEKKRLVIAVSTIAAIAFTGAVLYLAVSRPFITPAPKKPAPPAQTRKAPPPAAVPAKAVVTRQPAPLPAFIQSDTIDPSYAAANPGWERYRSKNREFKIFRENGDIKALQVIDTAGSGIPPEFFTSVLREMAKVSDYRLESKEKKDGFIIKKGKLSPAIRVIIYKDRADRILNAFVIHFQGQAATPPATKEKP